MCMYDNNIKSYIDLVYNPKKDIHIGTNVFLKLYTCILILDNWNRCILLVKKRFCSALSYCENDLKKVVKGSRKLMQPITDVTYKENIQLYKQRLTY